MTDAVRNADEWAMDRLAEQLAQVPAWLEACGNDPAAAAARIYRFGVNESEGAQLPYLIVEPAARSSWNSPDGMAYQGILGMQLRIIGDPGGETDEGAERRAFIRLCDGITQGLLDRTANRRNRAPYLITRAERVTGFEFSTADETGEKYDEALYEFDLAVVR